MHRELHHAQNSQRHRAEDHPGAHGLFAGQVGIERADAAEEQHAHEPRALHAQGREAEAVDIQRQLGDRDDGEQHALDQKGGGHPADQLLLLPRGTRDEPEKGEVDRHDAAELEEALAGVFGHGKALRQRPGKGPEQVPALHEEEHEIERAEQPEGRGPDARRDGAQLRQAAHDCRSAPAHILRRPAAETGQQAEHVRADRQGGEEAIEPRLVKIERQRQPQVIDQLAEGVVRGGQLRHGQHEQHQRGERREHRDCDRAGADAALLFGLQREDHAADAQEEILKRDDEKRVQRVERQQMAAFAAGQPSGTAQKPVDGKDMQCQKGEARGDGILLHDLHLQPGVVLVRMQAAPRDTARDHYHAGQPDPAFPRTLHVPVQIFSGGDKPGGKQRQRPPSGTQIHIRQHIHPERQQHFLPAGRERRLCRGERLLRPVGRFLRAGEFVFTLFFHR